MAKWISFSADFDFRHKSRAVTAYKAGTVEYLPNHIAKAAVASGKGAETEKPEGVETRAWLNG